MQHAVHLLHRHDHRMPVDTKKNHKDEALQVLPPVLKERPPVLPEVAGNSQKAKRTKLHRRPSSFKALQDVLKAGRRLQHRCTSSLVYQGDLFFKQLVQRWFRACRYSQVCNLLRLGPAFEDCSTGALLAPL